MFFEGNTAQGSLSYKLSLSVKGKDFVYLFFSRSPGESWLYQSKHIQIDTNWSCDPWIMKPQTPDPEGKG